VRYRRLESDTCAATATNITIDDDYSMAADFGAQVNLLFIHSVMVLVVIGLAILFVCRRRAAPTQGR
jgi:hypothetical protein